MLTIVFYTSNGPAAKHRSREIAAEKGNYTRVIDAGFWDGGKIGCDRVEVMSEVPGWQRKRIEEVYGDKIVDVEFQQEAEQQEEPERKPMGLMPAVAEKKAVHKGGGRWFVMTGEEKLSGPHDKAEAMRLAAEPVEA